MSRVLKILTICLLATLTGCAGGPGESLACAGRKAGGLLVMGAGAVTGALVNPLGGVAITRGGMAISRCSPTSPGSSPDPSTPSTTPKEMVRVCFRTAWANWLLEDHATVNEMHREVRNVLDGGPKNQDATMAAKEACAGDARTARGTSIVWECKKGDPECVGKERLKAKLNEVIPLSQEEGNIAMEAFLEAENETSAAR